MRTYSSSWCHPSSARCLALVQALAEAEGLAIVFAHHLRVVHHRSVGHHVLTVHLWAVAPGASTNTATRAKRYHIRQSSHKVLRLRLSVPLKRCTEIHVLWASVARSVVGVGRFRSI